MQAPAERTVAGLRCGEVLAALSEFVDGELNAATKVRIEDHLRGCDWCERFGERFSGVVGALRRELATAPELDSLVAARLRDALAKVTRS